MIIHFDDTELEVLVDDNSYRRRAVKEKDKLVLYYSLTHHVEIPVGAWVEYEGQVYSLFKASNFTKNSTRNFSYTLTLESGWAGAEKYKVKNPVDGRLKFPYTAKPHEFIQLIVDNMNMRESGWEVGECIDAVEQVISFNHAYCSDALNQIADAFDTEWEVEGKTIHLRKVEYYKDNPLALSYGKGNGFKKEISRSNKSDSRNFEILYVQGGTDNIVPSKYGNSELLLPKSQTLVYEGVSYLSSTDGRYITQKGKELVSKAEDSLDCSDISPKRVGTVTSVIEVDKGKHFYDFIDNTIPEELNFSDCLIEGETMTIIPQSGMLVGKEFDVKYKHAERRFEIVPQDIDGETMPNDIYKLAVGDKYAVFHVALPDAYVCNNSDKSGASWDMFREAARFFYENTGELFTFKGELDGIWAKKDWLNIGGRIKPGGYVLFSDEQFHPEGSLVRIISVKDFCNNPHSPTIELSNAPVSSSFQSSMNKVEETEVVIDNKHREAIQYTKRRFRDSQETIEMLKDAMLENFTDAISPIAVQTMAMLIGDESLQFRFVSDTTNPQSVVHNVTYNQATKILTVPAGIIQHMTLGIKTMSSSHKVSEYKFWSIPAFETPPLTDGDKKYYLYAKVSKADQTGVFYISEKAIAMEGVEGYYHLLMGVLNSEYDGERSYVSLYGFSEILPGRITTDKIVSSDGKTYFDLLLGEIGGNIKFLASDGSLKDVANLDRTDLDYLKEAFKDATTEIDGGVILSGFAGVRDALKNVIAALCGYNPTSEDDYPLIFAGASQGSVEYYGWTDNNYTHIYTQSATPSVGDNCYDRNGSIVGTATSVGGAQIIVLSTTGEVYQRNTGIDFTAKTPSIMEGNRAKFRVYKGGRCVSDYFETSGSYKTIYVQTYCPPLAFTTVLEVSENCYMALTAGAQFGVLMETNEEHDGYNCSLYNSSSYPCTVVKGTKSSYTQVGILSPGEMMDFVNIKGGWVLKNYTRYSTK